MNARWSRVWLAEILALLLLCGGAAWSSLSTQEQQILARFHDRWAQLPPGRQLKLRNGARRWAAMTPEQRQWRGYGRAGVAGQQSLRCRRRIHVSTGVA